MPPGLLDSRLPPVLRPPSGVFPELPPVHTQRENGFDWSPAPSAVSTLPPLPQLSAATRASRTCSWPLNTVQLHSPGPGRLGVWDQRTGEYRPICLRKDFKGQDVLPSGSPSKSLWVHEVTLLPLPGPPQQGAVSGFTRLLQLWPPCEG